MEHMSIVTNKYMYEKQYYHCTTQEQTWYSDSIDVGLNL